MTFDARSPPLSLVHCFRDTTIDYPIFQSSNFAGIEMAFQLKPTLYHPIESATFVPTLYRTIVPCTQTHGSAAMLCVFLFVCFALF